MAGNDGWMWQGRQYHQWFGHGTKPKDAVASRDTAKALDRRIHDLGHTLIASVPRSQRHHPALRLDADDHARLDRVMAAMVGGLRATVTSFAAHFFDVSPDAPYVGPFRDAAWLVAGATTLADLREASDALGGAAMAVGLDRWRGFLRGVDTRIAGSPAPLVVLARAPGPVQPLGDQMGDGRGTPGGAGKGAAAAVALAILLGAAAANVRAEDARQVAERFGLDLDTRAGQEAVAAYLYVKNGSAAVLAHLGADKVDRDGAAAALLQAVRARPGLLQDAVGGVPGGALDAVREAIRSAIPEPVSTDPEEISLIDTLRKAGATNGQIAAALENRRAEARTTTAEERRNTPGKATASTPLPPVHGPWLALTTQGKDGAAVPGQVADKLVGKSFENFRAFREAFWQAVADTPELAGGFNAANIARMRKGLAPYPPNPGGDRRYGPFELHHYPAISNNGPVYDFSIIRVMTPSQHDAIHYGRK